MILIPNKLIVTTKNFTQRKSIISFLIDCCGYKTPAILGTRNQFINYRYLDAENVMINPQSSFLDLSSNKYSNSPEWSNKISSENFWESYQPTLF